MRLCPLWADIPMDSGVLTGDRTRKTTPYLSSVANRPPEFFFGQRGRTFSLPKNKLLWVKLIMHETYRRMSTKNRSVLYNLNLITFSSSRKHVNAPAVWYSHVMSTRLVCGRLYPLGTFEINIQGTWTGHPL